MDKSVIRDVGVGLLACFLVSGHCCFPLRFVVHEEGIEVRVFQSTPAPHRAGPSIPIFHDDRYWNSEGLSIKAMAKALSLRGTPDGDEVGRTMAIQRLSSNPITGKRASVLICM